MPEAREVPNRRVVLAGKTICRIAAQAPWAWPLLSRPVMRFFDRASEGWDDRTRAGSPEHLQALASGLLEVSRVPERVLDLGCGTGAATLFLSREYPRASVRGLDLSPAMIAKANAKVGLDPEGRVAFRTGDAHSLPYPDDSFDLVTQVNMPIFFREISRVLRPGGSALITTSRGDATPFSTPEGLILRKLAGHGFDHVITGTAGQGTWVLGTMA